MPVKNSLINILNPGLPGYITIPMSREFDRIKAEIQRIWDSQNSHYLFLQSYESTIDALLALSLFQRYVIGNLNGASDFYVFLNRGNRSNGNVALRIGSYRLDSDEYRHIWSVLIGFGKLKSKYQLSDGFFEYADTIGFLRNCADLYNIPEYNEED